MKTCFVQPGSRLGWARNKRQPNLLDLQEPEPVNGKNGFKGGGGDLQPSHLADRLMAASHWQRSQPARDKCVVQGKERLS
eukprot:937415-Pelagomonas_calceolata.AAC.1